MLKKLLLGALSLLAVSQMALVALPVAAECDPGNSTSNALDCLQATEVSTTDATQAGQELPLVIGRIIRTLLGLLGIIFLVLMVYAGFLWMTARGDDDTVSKAKDIIRNAIIGLIIIFIAYALTGFIINAVINATNSQ